MKTTGATKPMSTGKVHTTQAAMRAPPCSGTGWASVAPAWPRGAAKRMRCCARCSSHSNSSTSANNMVESWAAAVRLSMDNQALRMPVVKVWMPK